MSTVLEAGVEDKQANFSIIGNPTNFQKALKVTKMEHPCLSGGSFL